MNKTYLIDNSALNGVLSDSGVTISVHKHITKSTHSLLISFDSYLELLNGNNYETIEEKVLNLHALLNYSDPHRIALTLSAFRWLQLEAKNHGTLTSVPLMCNEPDWADFLERLGGAEKFRSHYCSQPRSHKNSFKQIHESMVDTDKNYRIISKQLSQNELRQAIDSFNLDLTVDEIRVLGYGLYISDETIKRIFNRSHPDQYRIHWIYMALMKLRFLGNSYSSFKQNDPLNFLHKISKGNWYDLGIITQAAYCDFLITNDKDQRAMCNFLHKKGLIKAQGIAIDDFFTLIKTT